MYTTFNIIIGLPGSGKTTLANMWFEQNPSAILLDDLSRNLMGGVERFNLAKTNTVIITDPRMCGVPEEKIKEVISKHFKDGSDHFDFKFYYFENDPEACIINARCNPKPGGTENFIRQWTKGYTIPEGAIMFPVYKG